MGSRFHMTTSINSAAERRGPSAAGTGRAPARDPTNKAAASGRVQMVKRGGKTLNKPLECGLGYMDVNQSTRLQ